MKQALVLTSIVVLFLVFTFVYFGRMSMRANAEYKKTVDKLESVINTMEIDTKNRVSFLSQANSMLAATVASLEVQRSEMSRQMGEIRKSVSNIKVSYQSAKDMKDTSAMVSSCDSLFDEYYSFVKMSDQKDIVVDSIIRSKDAQLVLKDSALYITTIYADSVKVAFDKSVEINKKLLKDSKKLERKSIFRMLEGIGIGAAAYAFLRYLSLIIK